MLQQERRFTKVSIRQLKTLVNTYDNSNKISFLDNIAKTLTF